MTRRPSVSAASRVCLLLVLLALAAPLHSAEEPRAWLGRMNQAVEQLNYQGTVVHLHGDEADVLRIVHRVQDGRVTERITALDDGGREIIRNDDEVTCILPDQASVVVEKRDDRDSSQSPLRGRLPTLESLDEMNYHLAFDGDGTVAGRGARQLAVRPKDGFRYGYRLWLDEETAMPLKIQLSDERGDIIEQIMFSEISLLDSIPAGDVEPSVLMDAFTVQRVPEPMPAKADGAAADWEATRLPPGFMLVAARSKFAPGAGAPMDHIVYTDGLATVSVFIEMVAEAGEQAEGASMMGAANAFTTIRDDHLITAMGEVPVRTVEMIALSMQPRAGSR